jgi:hypothetical protein
MNTDPYLNNSQEIRSGVPAARSTRNDELGFPNRREKMKKRGELTCLETLQIHGTCNKSREMGSISRPQIDEEHEQEEEEEVEHLPAAQAGSDKNEGGGRRRDI